MTKTRLSLMKCGVRTDSIFTSPPPPSWAPISCTNRSRSHDVAEPSVTVLIGNRAMSAIFSTSPATASSSQLANHCMTSSYDIPYIVRNTARAVELLGEDHVHPVVEGP